ncbi:MAG: ATP-binding protein [Nitrososphaerota archaeon]|nr:ATP-binding protein [Nitrososphaerota archaeon]MDG6966351.1 ATP-binding protein [Nitrososphaerota archaeon]MDG6977786.1 ATP-binding protein [Nitrososphaerota archaeon]MDG7020855.1 ATP-binding protein [Nitrososphaerota archaeon]
MFCGIPGSGKTTIARLVVRSLGRAVHIQTDVLRQMIAQPTYGWREARFVYESATLLGRRALMEGYDAVLDGTFLREEYRAEARRRLWRHCSSCLVVCVACDTEVARRRNSSRQEAVPASSFDRLARSFEAPEECLLVRSDETTPELAAERVLRAVIGEGPRF